MQKPEAEKLPASGFLFSESSILTLLYIMPQTSPDSFIEMAPGAQREQVHPIAGPQHDGYTGYAVWVMAGDAHNNVAQALTIVLIGVQQGDIVPGKEAGCGILKIHIRLFGPPNYQVIRDGVAPIQESRVCMACIGAVISLVLHGRLPRPVRAWIPVSVKCSEVLIVKGIYQVVQMTV